MHASLSRTLHGIAHQLHHVVLPELDDDYAAAQVRAAIELLGNLQTRVVVDPAQQLASIRADRDVLAAVASVDADAAELASLRAVLEAPLPDPEDAEAIEVASRSHAAAVSDAIGWLGSTSDPAAIALLDRVRARIADQLSHDLARLRTASFGR